MEMSRKKPHFVIHQELREYLDNHERSAPISISYEELRDFSDSIPVVNLMGENTLWESVMYSNYKQEEVNKALVDIYAQLKTDGDQSFVGHLRADRIDYCLFGNSHPFRIRIVNTLNDNHDYYYIKKADASRIYGLEIEHLLSPNRISFLVDKGTLVEEHIAGIPGDLFLDRYRDRPGFAKIRLAKEFVKFNERCFTLLLGDMRAYNYVIDVTPDFDMEQYRVRAIDFDQFSYEGRRNNYRPQFYKENLEIMQYCLEVLSPETVDQYQTEERTLIRKRYLRDKLLIDELLDSMEKTSLSSPSKVRSLAEDLKIFHKSHDFDRSKSMGSIFKLHLSKMIERTKHLDFSGKSSFK